MLEWCDRVEISPSMAEFEEFEDACHELRNTGSLQMLGTAGRQIFPHEPPGRNIAFLANSLNPVRQVLEL